MQSFAHSLGLWESLFVGHFLLLLIMRAELTFNEWQAHLTKQLEKDYLKLKLIKNDKLQTVRQRKSNRVRGI